MLLSENHLDAVYDVTLGFPDHIPQHILDIPTGNYPKEVHFHIKRYYIYFKSDYLNKFHNNDSK